MMLETFQYSDKTVRVQMINGEPWWIAKDVCEALGLGQVTRALDRLEDDEKGVTISKTLGGEQKMTIVNEPGLYSLILRSRKHEARQFKRWVTHTVLPEIRKSGSFGAKLPTDYKTALLALVSEIEAKEALESKAKALEARIESDSPKVEFAMQVGSALNAMSVQNAAKVLGTGELRLYSWLRSHKLLMTGGDTHNRPFQQFIERGYFRVVEVPWRTPAGEQMKSEKTLITSKGLVYIWKKMKQSGEPVPHSCPLAETA